MGAHQPSFLHWTLTLMALHLPVPGSVHQDCGAVECASSQCGKSPVGILQRKRNRDRFQLKLLREMSVFLLSASLA